MGPNFKGRGGTTLHLNESQFHALIICLGDITWTVTHLDEKCECCRMTSVIGQGSLGGLYWWWGTICCKFGTGVSLEASPQGGQTGWGNSLNIRWIVLTILASWQKNKTNPKQTKTIPQDLQPKMLNKNDFLLDIWVQCTVAKEKPNIFLLQSFTWEGKTLGLTLMSYHQDSFLCWFSTVLANPKE